MQNIRNTQIFHYNKLIMGGTCGISFQCCFANGLDGQNEYSIQNPSISGLIYNECESTIVYVVSQSAYIYEGNSQTKIPYLQRGQQNQQSVFVHNPNLSTITAVPSKSFSFIHLKRDPQMYFSLYVGEAKDEKSVVGFPLFMNVPILEKENILWKVTLNEKRNRVVYKRINEKKVVQIVQKQLASQLLKQKQMM